MSLLRLWTLIIANTMQSIEGQRALRIHQNYLNLCSEDEQKSLRVWNDMKASNDSNLNFWVNYPFNIKTKYAMEKNSHCT